jgi:hypothetical protein
MNDEVLLLQASVSELATLERVIDSILTGGDVVHTSAAERNLSSLSVSISIALDDYEERND